MTFQRASNFQNYVMQLKKVFNEPASDPCKIFSTSGVIDFLCTDGEIGNKLEERILNENALKGVVLHFLDNGFFEPVFIVKAQKLFAFKKKKQVARINIQLFPDYVWAPECFPHVRPDFLDLESQLKTAGNEYLERINLLNEMLNELKSADCIFLLERDRAESEKARKTVWKVVVCGLTD